MDTGALPLLVIVVVTSTVDVWNVVPWVFTSCTIVSLSGVCGGPASVYVVRKPVVPSAVTVAVMPGFVGSSTTRPGAGLKSVATYVVPVVYEMNELYEVPGWPSPNNTFCWEPVEIVTG